MARPPPSTRPPTAPRTAPPGPRAPTRRGILTRYPVARFIIVLLVLMGAFGALYYAPVTRDGPADRFFQAYLGTYAQAAGFVLRMTGEKASVSGQEIYSPRFRARVVKGCDAIEAKALFVFAVLAFPATWRARAWGILAGLAALTAINLIRIVSLFYFGAYLSKTRFDAAAFDRVHLEIWQSLFIVLAVGLWVAWAIWATRKPRGATAPDPHAHAAA